MEKTLVVPGITERISSDYVFYYSCSACGDYSLVVGYKFCPMCGLAVEFRERRTPQLSSDPNLTSVIDAVEAYMDRIKEDGCDADTDDEQHAIFEAVLEAFYGVKVWDWVNGEN